MGDLLGDITEDCALEAEAKKSRILLRVDGPCTVVGERELLHRAVENIVRNAIRHTPDGTAVEITLQPSADATSITVRDHGPGVPEELLSAIFQPFFRVEGHRSRESGGVGLGLAIARRAIALHHGNISASNAKPGPGLVVTMTLPNAQAADLGT